MPVFCLIALLCRPASAAEADKCFTEGGVTACVAHPQKAAADFAIDVPARSIQARARIDFVTAATAAKAYFLFERQARRVLLDGQAVSPQHRLTPDGENRILVVPLPGNAAGTHRLEVDYAVTGLTAWGLQWQPFHWLTDFSDSSDARFINAFVPASYEADRYPMDWHFSFRGAPAQLQVYSNASGIRRAPGRFQLRFDERSNLASPYFEFSSRPYQRLDFAYQGYYQPIPVTIYLDPRLRPAPALLKRAEQLTRAALRRFEAGMGPYAFGSLLVKVYSLQTGDVPLAQEYSMEYGGAIVSRMELIPHEICHQWFGRGASPRDGQAGFADELICDWYDYANPVARPGAPVARLVPGSVWTLRTPPESYQEGRFMAGLSWLLKQDRQDVYGRLKDFYRRFRLQSYSDRDFVQHFGNTSILKAYLEANIYGQR